MHVTFLCGREPNYVRNALCLKALRQLGDLEVLTSVRRGTAARLAEVLLQFFKARTRIQHSDMLWVGFWGHPIVIAIAPFVRNRIVFDAYISVFNTVCEDRRLFSPHSPLGRLALWMDQAACRAADLVLLDTQAHSDYFQSVLQVPASKIRILFVGCDETLFSRQPGTSKSDLFTIFSYSSFLPLHGVDTIIRAAAELLGEPSTRFIVGGEGSLLQNAQSLARSLHCENVHFIKWVPFGSLPQQIADSDICLAGPFGPSNKAQMVVPTKTYQFMAMGKAIIASDTPANREVLQHQTTALLVPVADSAALAAAICELHTDEDLRTRLAANAYQHFQANFSSAALTQRVALIAKEALCASAL